MYMKSLIWSTLGMQYMPDKENAVRLASNSVHLNNYVLMYYI